MPKIVMALNLTEAQLASVTNAAPDFEVISGKDPAVWQSHLNDADVIVGWNKHAEDALLSGNTPLLKWVHNWGAGVDRLPLATFKAHGVTLTNSSGVHAYPISETILAMMLGLTRKIHTYVRNQQKHVWHHANLSAEMHEKTVLILGVGAIGLETARLCKAFGMRVLGIRRSGGSSEYVDAMYTMDDLLMVLGEADYVVNTLPHTKATDQLMGAAQFEAMKNTAFYINIGRGKTTVEPELIRALNEGTIAGAGLDVFETEPLPSESPLWDMENVILTPHTSGSNEHYNDRALAIFTKNLPAFAAGRAITHNVVDLDLEY